MSCPLANSIHQHWHDQHANCIKYFLRCKSNHHQAVVASTMRLVHSEAHDAVVVCRPNTYSLQKQRAQPWWVCH